MLLADARRSTSVDSPSSRGDNTLGDPRRLWNQHRSGHGCQRQLEEVPRDGPGADDTVICVVWNIVNRQRRLVGLGGVRCDGAGSAMLVLAMTACGVSRLRPAVCLFADHCIAVRRCTVCGSAAASTNRFEQCVQSGAARHKDQGDQNDGGLCQAGDGPIVVRGPAAVNQWPA